MHLAAGAGVAMVILAAGDSDQADPSRATTHVTGRYVGCATRHLLKEVRRRPERFAGGLPRGCHVTPAGRPATLEASTAYFQRIRYLGEDGRWTTVWTLPRNLVAAK